MPATKTALTTVTLTITTVPRNKTGWLRGVDTNGTVHAWTGARDNYTMGETVQVRGEWSAMHYNQIQGTFARRVAG